ncbi:hypothetical protein [Colwellia sp. E150_009]
MKKWHVEFNSEFTVTPISYWVHVNLDNDIWSYANKFEPPFPKPIPCKGFPLLVVNVLGVQLEFASVHEVLHFIDVIGQRNMPSTIELSRKRSDGYGPNRHWLSRLPAKLKPWSKREKLIPVIEAALKEYRQVCQ